MKTVDQHLEDCLSAVDTLSPLELRLLDALGCTLSRGRHCHLGPAAVHNSSMDGYAVRSADVAGASSRRPSSCRSSVTSPPGSPGRWPSRLGSAPGS